MKRLLLTTALLAAVGASPAYPALQLAFQNGANTLQCADGSACDDAGQANNVIVFNQQVGAFHIDGTATSNTGDTINESNLTITNTSNTTQTLVFAASQNGFVGPVGRVSMSGSGTFDNAIGGSGSLSFHGDPNNALGANTATDTPGTLLFNPSTSVTTDPQAFSGNDIMAAFNAAGPFSMTLDYTITLPAGGQIVGLESAMTASAVPEPSTWVMMGGGFALLSLLGLRKRNRTPRFAI